MSISLPTIQRKYNTQSKCIAYLEKLRWGRIVLSPFTCKPNVTKREGTYKYHCNDTNRDFTVMYGTIFQDTRLPLPTWFRIIAQMLNAKKGIASAQIMRNEGISYKTAWYTQMRIRCAMIDPDLELEGMLEMDEAFAGGKPKKVYRKNTDDSEANLSMVTHKRGRGTKKTPFVGISEKRGKVATKVIHTLSSRNLMAMLKRYVELEESAVITDGFRSYKAFDKVIDHITITKRQKLMPKGMLNTATLDSFFSIVKKGIPGNYVVISKKYLPFYLIEFQYKFNNRHTEKGAFEKLLQQAVCDEKEMLYYKPVKQVRTIVYPKKKSAKVRARMDRAIVNGKVVSKKLTINKIEN